MIKKNRRAVNWIFWSRREIIWKWRWCWSRGR